MPLPYRVVLVRPIHPGNIGAAARAMQNCGLTDLAVVGSRFEPWPDDARRMASGADAVLDGARFVPTVEDALLGVVLAAGTTCRSRADRVPVATLEDAAPSLAEASKDGTVAVLFGPEDKGLSAEDLALCSVRIRIPTSDLHTSLNLAQAVLLVAHELFLLGQPPRQDDSMPDTATVDELEAMFDHLRPLLDSIGFLNPQNPAHVFDQIRQIFLRARLSRHEVQLLRGAVRQFDWALNRRRDAP